MSSLGNGGELEVEREATSAVDVHFKGFEDLLCQVRIEVGFGDDWGRRLKVLGLGRMRNGVFLLTRKLCSRLIFMFVDGIPFPFL